MPAPSELVARLERVLQERQAEQKLPSVAAAVLRDGEVGLVGGRRPRRSRSEGRPATPDLQYRVGSITKTFTAAAIMQLRDAGQLDLDDRLEQHLPGIAHGSPTLRRLLSHLSGLQREAGEMFVTGDSPTIAEVIAQMDRFELVLPAARAHHYSNLAYGLLGEVVARRERDPYTEYVDAAPAAAARARADDAGTSRSRYALGYLVDEYTRHRRPRAPRPTCAGVAAMGQLWSTVGDLCRWGAVLAAGRAGVLDPATRRGALGAAGDDEPGRLDGRLGARARACQSVTAAIFGGHGGAMAGFLAGLYVNRAT